MLLNGEENYALEVNNGEVVRLYVTNAANARPFNFAIEGARMKLVGADGGAYEQENFVDSVLLGPSERAVVEVLFDTPGTYSIENTTPAKTYQLGTVVVSNELVAQSYAAQFQTLRSHEGTIASMDPFRSIFTKAPDKRLALSVDMMGDMMSSAGGHMMPDGTMMGGMSMGGMPEGGIEWDDTDMQMMNDMSDTESVKWHMIDQDTGKKIWISIGHCNAANLSKFASRTSRTPCTPCSTRSTFTVSDFSSLRATVCEKRISYGKTPCS